MDSQLFCIGQKIYINFEDDELNNFKYASQIIDVLDSKNLIISSPFYKGSRFRVRFGEYIKILLINENGLYVYQGNGAEEIIENNVRIYKIILDDQVKRVQRRNDFRVPINLSMVYKFSNQDGEFYGQGITKDISGGGIRFICSDQLHAGDNINVIFKINEEYEFFSNAKVIRSNNLGVKKFEISTEYKNLKHNKKEELIKFLFLMQQEKLRAQNNK